MASFKIVKGDVLVHKTDKKLLIPHIVNDEGKLGAGLAAALAHKWPVVRHNYLDWFNNYDLKQPAKLGRNQYVPVEPGIVVVNMVAQSDCGGYRGLPPIRYQSLEECLMRLEFILSNRVTNELEIATGMIGTGLAGGKFPIISEIVERVFKDVDIAWTWYEYD